MDLAEIEHRIATLKALGNKGTTGTQASFLELFGGNHAKARELDERICRAIGSKTGLTTKVFGCRSRSLPWSSR